MKYLKSYLWNILIIVGITAIAMYFSLKDDFSRVVDAILQMHLGYLFLCLGWGILFTLVWGLSYRVIARRYKKDYSAREGAIVAFVGTFFNGITPSATGGQFAQVYVFHRQGISPSDGASILWADFIIYQTSMMIYVTVLFFLDIDNYVEAGSWFWIVVAGYLVNVFVVTGLYLIAFFPGFIKWCAGWLAKFLAAVHLIKDAQAKTQHWHEQVNNFNVQVKLLSKDWNMIIKVFILNIIRLTLYFSLPYLIAKGLAITVKGEFLNTLTMSSFVVMANSFIPLPGASGGTEVVFQVLFYPLFKGLTAAVMLIWRISSYYLIVILGAIVFILFKGKHDRDMDMDELKKSTEVT